MPARINGTNQLEARTGALLISSKTSPGAAMTLVRRSVSDEGSGEAPSDGGEGIGSVSMVILTNSYHIGPPAQSISRILSGNRSMPARPRAWAGCRERAVLFRPCAIVRPLSNQRAQLVI